MKRLLVLLLFVPFLGHGQNRVAVEGTKASIIKPENFKASEAFTGFIDLSSSCTIAFSESDTVSYTTIAPAFNDEYFTSQQLTVLGKEEVMISGYPAKLFHLAFTVNNVKIERYILLTGTDSYFLFALCNYPVAFKPAVENNLKQTMLSIQFDDGKE